MKYLIIKMIRLYQITPFGTHNKCRFLPTCSNYMIFALNEHGLFKGLFLGIKRILRCHPLGKKGYDPVPRKRDKR